MNMKLSLLAMLFFSASIFADAQNAEDSVKQVITGLFDAMRASDTARLKSCFTTTGLLQGFQKGKDGTMGISTTSVSDFCRSVGSSPAGTLDERIIFKEILIDDNLAVVWTPYQFFLKGVFSHCGVNSFQMVRLNGEWKIQYIIDTRRKGSCLE